MPYKGYDPGQSKNVQRYLKDNFVQVGLRFRPEWKKMVDDHLDYTGESMRAFIIRAVEETIARDKKKLAAAAKNIPDLPEE